MSKRKAGYSCGDARNNLIRELSKFRIDLLFDDVTC